MFISFIAKEGSEPGCRCLSQGIYEFNKQNYKAAVSLFEESSSYGNEYGQLFAGILHTIGFGDIEKNSGKAYVYFIMAAAKWKNSIAAYLIGVLYLKGEGMNKNPELGLKWLSLSAESGWSEAKVRLAQEYHFGLNGIKKDLVKAVFWYSKVVGSNLVWDRSRLFLFGNVDLKISFSDIEEGILKKTLSFRTNFETSLANVRTLSKSKSYFLFYWDSLTNDFTTGITQSQLALGCIYKEGVEGIPVDYDQAMHYLLLADQGISPAASYHIGTLYQKGLGVTKSFAEAKTWYEKSYSMGFIYSLYKLGYINYTGGHGTKKNLSFALENFNEYIENCKNNLDIRAYYYIGNIYQHGSKSVQVDYKNAMICYLNAYKGGHASSACAIGSLYFGGLGVEKNRDEEFKWYTKAADMNCAEGHHLLGVMFLQGYVKSLESLKCASKHFAIAFKNGFADSEAMFRKAEKMISNYNIKDVYSCYIE